MKKRVGASDFDEFFAATFQRVVGQVYAMTGNLADAEDAVQDAYARAWVRWDKLCGLEQPEAWVRVVAYRISVSAWRKTVNRLTAHRRFQGDEQVPGLGPDHVALVQALRRISPEQRRAIVLYHLVGLSVDEVAAETGASTGTVTSRLARARRALAPHVSESDPPEREQRPDTRLSCLRERFRDVGDVGAGPAGSPRAESGRVAGPGVPDRFMGLGALRPDIRVHRVRRGDVDRGGARRKPGHRDRIRRAVVGRDHPHHDERGRADHVLAGHLP